MVERLPSLEPILSLVQEERGRQLEHFDSLDAKAGIILGFAGVLVALSTGNQSAWGAAGLPMGLMAACTAL